ncbi:ElaB/YqjD/DUF883 family membrane-anchored ribosome-binding protein [Leifsonia sp. AK011]|uniref:hypothetical protein n=1 Tax=Leifsonia sp. AK011 TaxID=2723075 RepID=UPI0015C8D5C2|nr:hypothetical protein [Leifsonia sp. AK011]NYF09957.1 ElaB/YqjD/DUF883 family membrane-anchored ribosome-binding protein [Leifsonia sp. AK011]
MDLLAGASLAIGTFLVLALIIGVVAFAVLFVRRGDSRTARAGSGIAELSRRAGTLLVRLDDAVREAEDEVGYAVAQFGTDRAQPFADSLDDAQRKLAEAFRLRQALDDAVPDSDRERREWTLQIIALCEQAEELLARQDDAFRRLRSVEANAAGSLEDLRRRIRDSSARVVEARTTIATLRDGYADRVVRDVAGNAERAERLLALAAEHADATAADIHESGVNSVSGRLTEAAQAAREADGLLDAVDRRARELEAAASALADRRTTAAADVAEARRELDSAPDPDSGARILSAIERVTAFEPRSPADPVADLDELGESIEDLDLALASSRNQAQRLAHARAAYEGTLVSARSQIAVARDLVARGHTGVAARTRLAEAERQFEIAQAETDPVEALDAIRRAVTHARDADALARYDSR